MNKICIVGVGFAGLHLVECFSRKHTIIAFDISSDRIKFLKDKHPIENVFYTDDFKNIVDCDLYCISVPTLLNEDKTVNHKFVEKAIDMVDSIIKPGATVVLESSVSVGISRNLLKTLYDKGVYVGFSPERVDPGRTEPPAYKITKIVSGYDEKSKNKIFDWYNTVYENVISVSSMETAEMIKLYENCFRLVNISYINEISDSCKNFDIDVNEVINGASTKPFGYMPFNPSLGVGGTCIPVNPYYLFANNELPVLKKATEFNEERPIKKANDLIESYNPNNILIIGLAYKPGEKITYCSPSISFAKELINKGLTVEYYDPLVNIDYINKISSSNWNVNDLKKYDLICVCTKQINIDYSILDEIPKEKIVVF